jgi:hypothetical protein
MATSRQFNYINSALDTTQYYNKECIFLGLSVPILIQTGFSMSIK